MGLRDGRSRTALELSPVNLVLRGEAERELIWKRYRRALAALMGPLSLYTYSRPLAPNDVDGLASGTPSRADREFRRSLLAGGQVHAQRHLAVVWDDPAPGPGAALVRRRGEGRPAADLDQRVEAMAAAFTRAGLRASRLAPGDWLRLLQDHTGGRSGRVPAEFGSWLAPDSAAIAADRVRLPGRTCRSLVVQGFPRRLGLGWLGPVVLSPPCALRLAQHLYPVPKLASLGHLRRRIRTFETGLEGDRLRGRRPDAGTRAALGDALELEERVLLEEERLFRMTLCITLEAGAEDELEVCWQRLLAALAELGCTPIPLSHRQVDGWRSTLPTGVDALGWTRDMTAGAAATALPFMRAGLGVTSGVLVGPSPLSRELVNVDLFGPSNPNHNAIVLGTSGGGKSYTAKLLAARLSLAGCRVRCLDPSGEYRGVAELLGGSVLELGAQGATGMNLLGPNSAGPDEGGRAARVLSLLDRLLAAEGAGGRLGANARAEVSEVVGRTLRADSGGASAWELADQLLGAGLGQVARALSRFLEGPDRGIFDGRGEPRLAPVAVVSLKHLTGARARLLGPAMEMVLWYLESELEGGAAGPALVLVDEAEVLLSSESSARFLEATARRIRKQGAGLMVVSQVVEDFLGSNVGNVVIRNCHTKLLLRQEAVALPAVRRAFSLSPAEGELLQGAQAGEGLVVSGEEHAAFRGAAPPSWRPALLTGAGALGR